MGIRSHFQAISSRLLEYLLNNQIYFWGIAQLPEVFDLIGEDLLQIKLNGDSWAEYYRAKQMELFDKEKFVDFRIGLKNMDQEHIAQVVGKYGSLEKYSDMQERFIENALQDHLKWLKGKIDQMIELEKQKFSPMDSDTRIDIGKSWPELYSLLKIHGTGDNKDLSKLIYGGNKIGQDTDDSAWYLTPIEVAQGATDLALVDDKNAIERACMAGLIDMSPFAYGGIIHIDLDEKYRGVIRTADKRVIRTKGALSTQIFDLISLMNMVREYYKTASTKGFGMITHLG